MNYFSLGTREVFFAGDDQKARKEVSGLILCLDLYLHWVSVVCVFMAMPIKVRPRFFDQVRHETMYAVSGNKYFFTKSCHHQTYQNYEQSRQKLGTILENKVS